MIAAIDIGGTNTRIAIYGKNEKDLVERTSFLTIKEDPKKNFLAIISFVKKFKDIKAISMSFPGVAPKDAKKFNVMVNLPKWNFFPFYDFVKKESGIKKIFMENDANVMALANHYYFKQNLQDITQFFTVSTGLGAGLIINNQIFKGANSWAQEIAHLPTAWKAEAGKNLGLGSVEYFSSGSGLLLRIQKQGLKIKNTKELFELYPHNTKAKKVIDEGIEALANLIAIHCSIVNPNLIVFDGSVARHNHWYVEKAIALSKARMFEGQFNSTKFKFAQLDDDSALIGSYLLAKNQLDI